MTMNPIKDARLRMGLTINALAKQADVTSGYIIQAEHGRFDTVSDKLVSSLNLTTQNLNDYETWRIAQRKSLRLQAPPPELRNSKTHPFSYFRMFNTLTVAGMANALCIHAYTITRYERAGVRSMPAALSDALSQTNLSPTSIVSISDAGCNFYDSIVAVGV